MVVMLRYFSIHYESLVALYSYNYIYNTHTSPDFIFTLPLNYLVFLLFSYFNSLFDHFSLHYLCAPITNMPQSPGPLPLPLVAHVVESVAFILQRVLGHIAGQAVGARRHSRQHQPLDTVLCAFLYHSLNVGRRGFVKTMV